MVLGHAQDFSKEYSDIRDELATLYSVVGLDRYISRIFLVGKEPDKSLEYNHQLWGEFRVLKGITYIESESDLGDCCGAFGGDWFGGVSFIYEIE